MFNLSLIEEFITKIRKIPGTSRKQAEKIVAWILYSKDDEIYELSNYFKKLKDNISFCSFCNIPQENNNCYICNDTSRENKLLVVENPLIIEKLEKLSLFKGKYFVFKNLVKNEKSLDKFYLDLSKLLKYCKNFEEVIFGISPTLEGEVTTNLIRKEFEKFQINSSQLAIGIPIGASIDYMDEITLKFSIKNRQK